jgi:small subunit ribosomal protein S9
VTDDQATPSVPGSEPTATPTPVTAEPAMELAVPAPPQTMVSKKRRVVEQGGYFWGTGRRKSSVARVRIRAGDGKFIINSRDKEDFFKIPKDLQMITAPLVAADCGRKIDVFVNVRGGGITGQSGAVVLGLARALCGFNPDYEIQMREGNFLTRDSREVERKKYGQRGARRRFQFSKR